MKILKLLGLILVTVGLIIGISYIPDIKEMVFPSQRDNKIFQKLENDIKANWENAEAAWDISKYRDTDADIQYNRRKLGDGGLQTLKEANGFGAVKVLNRHFMAEFAKEECSTQEVKHFNTDADTLYRKPEMTDEGKRLLKQGMDTYRLYTSILQFGSQSVVCSVNFNKSTGRFNDFATFEHQKKQQRDRLKHHACYNNLRNARTVKNAFSSFESKLATCRTNYPNRVRNAIIDAFRYEERNDENLDLLKKAANNYSAKYSRNSALDSFYKEFHQTVQNRKKQLSEQGRKHPSDIPMTSERKKKTITLKDLKNELEG